MQLARTYDACGMPVLPQSECVALARWYRVPIILAASEVLLDITQVMEKDFLLRGIAIDPNNSDVKLRIRVAKNYYLSNARIRANLLARGGRLSRAYEPEMLIPRGEAVSIEAANLTGA